MNHKISPVLLVLFVLSGLALANGGEIGDVSIKPSRDIFKKRIFGPSIEPFLREQSLVTKQERPRSVKSTTPVSTTTITAKPFTLPHYPEEGFHTQRDITDFRNNFGDYIRGAKGSTASGHEIELVTVPVNHDHDDRPYPFNGDTNSIKNRPIRPVSRPDPDRPAYDRPPSPDHHRMPSQAGDPKTHYRTVILDQPLAPVNNELYPEPIVRFVEQYRCDLNVSTCGLKNEPQLKDMFYLEEIRDINNRQRCFVADTSRAKWANMFGARLITRYFPTFGMPAACFELIFFANGPGIMDLTVAQQDTETAVIWRLRDPHYSAELSFQQIRRQKIDVKLREGDPRFFITVNLDPNRIGRIGILGFNFSYGRCEKL